MGFTKLDEGILRSSIMAEPAEIFKVFIAILASTDPDGIARLSSTFLAGACYLPITTVDTALAALEAPDPRSRTMAEDGRRIRRVDGGYFVINYHQYRERGYSQSESAIAKRAYREKKSRQEQDIVRTLSGRSASASASGFEFDLREKAGAIISKWNDYAHAHEIPWVRSLEKGSARERALFARLKDPAWDFEKILEAISAQPFLTGDNDRGWLVTFDFILKPANATKILEGAYTKIRKGEAARRAPDDPRVGARDYGRK